jgi:hypothetical protein
MVVLTDNRQNVGSGASKSRILLRVEESLIQRGGAPMTPEIWFVNPVQLIQALQASPAFVEGSYSDIVNNHSFPIYLLRAYPALYLST